MKLTSPKRSLRLLLRKQFKANSSRSSSPLTRSASAILKINDSMDLDAVDIELKEFNCEDMENLVINDKEDGEVDDASITTNPPV